MLLIESLHPALLNAVKRILSRENAVLTTAVRDFDGCELLISVDQAPLPANATLQDEAAAAAAACSVVIKLKHVVSRKILDSFGNFESVITSLLTPGAATGSGGASLNVAFPPAGPTIVNVTVSDGRNEDLLAKISQLRALSYVPIFKHVFELFLAGTADKITPVRIPYHAGESLYLYQTKGTNLICCISLNISGRDELVFLRNFLQTFQDAKKLEKSISGAPAFVFSNGKAPIDMPKGLAGEAETEHVFWCSFQLFKLQMERPQRVMETVTQLVNFRNIVLYHIHCCRSYMHGIMRKRVEASVQVINRAKTSTTGKAKVTIK
jgi:actin related protein 2/3 complex subunit 2